MHKLVAMDPGKRLAAWAAFDDSNQLVFAELRHYDSYRNLGLDSCETLLCEWPQIYPGPRTADPNDLLPLTACIGAVAALTKHATLTTVAPRIWTGSRPKIPNHARIYKRLSETERSVLEAAFLGVAKSLQHNIIDAVGIGLYGLGRL